MIRWTSPPRRETGSWSLIRPACWMKRWRIIRLRCCYHWRGACMRRMPRCNAANGRISGAMMSVGRRWGLLGLDASEKQWRGGAAGFNMRVLAHTAHPSPEKGGGIEFVSLEKLLAESDFVSLHAALTPSTR